MTPKDRGRYKELVEQLNKGKAEVSKLKSSLNALDSEKESWFRKKKDISRSIREGIQKIKDNKAKRDFLTGEVKDLKQKRDSINNEAAAKSDEFDNLKKERAELAKALDVKKSPSEIRKGIEQLEFKIETEPMPFSKEQSVMKKIRELKNLHKKSSALESSDRKVSEASDAIRKLRKEANEAHELIQAKARESQALHEEILMLSSEIDKLKADEDEKFRKFSEHKAMFNEVNSQLKERLRSMSDARYQLERIELARKEKRKREEESILRSKEEKINDKIKRGGKLTTDDLLAFQQYARIVRTSKK